MEDEVTLHVGEKAVRWWAEMKKISSRTRDTIINMSYTSMKALSLLTEEDVADCQDIPVGQRRLLVHSILGTSPLCLTGASSDRDPHTANATNQNAASAGPSAGPSAPQRETCSQHNQTTRPSPEAQETFFIRNVLGQLHRQQAPVPTSDSGMVSWKNPQFFFVISYDWVTGMSEC